MTNLNVALEKLDSAVSAGDVSSIISLQGALKFNGGGHLNHTLFWENLAPSSSTELSDGPLKVLINECFGDFESMKEQMSASTIAVQGSGWGWLGYNKKTGKKAHFWPLRVFAYFSKRLVSISLNRQN